MAEATGEVALDKVPFPFRPMGGFVATGETFHVPVNSSGRPVPMPPAHLAQLQAFADSGAPAGG